MINPPDSLGTNALALIAAAMDLANIGERTAALTSIGPYESRVKGGRTGIAATRRASVKARNVKRNRAAHRNRAN